MEVVASIVCTENKKILYCQRGKSKNQESHYRWEFPGGKVQLGESLEAAVHRELYEELNVEVLRTFPFAEIDAVSGSSTFPIHFFFAQVKGPLQPQVHRAFTWLPFSKEVPFRLCPPDRKALDQLSENHFRVIGQFLRAKSH